MAETPKFRRPRWRDPRLGVGIILVAASVALGAWFFARADHTVAVYRATSTVAIGQPVAQASVDLVNVNLAQIQDLYVTAEDLHSDAIFIRSVPTGELIPRSALGAAEDLNYRPVTVSTTDPVAIEIGAVVDLWVSPTDGQETAEPELVAAGLAVSGVEEDTSLFTAGRGSIVRVLVPEDDVGRVLASLDPRSTVTLVPRLGG